MIDHYFQTGQKGFEKATGDDGNTALHIRQPDCVRLILEGFPSLVSQANASKQTPLDMAKATLENLVAWQAHMHKENRRTGSASDFTAIISQLEFATAQMGERLQLPAQRTVFLMV